MTVLRMSEVIRGRLLLIRARGWVIHLRARRGGERLRAIRIAVQGRRRTRPPGVRPLLLWLLLISGPGSLRRRAARLKSRRRVAGARVGTPGLRVLLLLLLHVLRLWRRHLSPGCRALRRIVAVGVCRPTPSRHGIAIAVTMVALRRALRRRSGRRRAMLARAAHRRHGLGPARVHHARVRARRGHGLGSAGRRSSAEDVGEGCISLVVVRFGVAAWALRSRSRIIGIIRHCEGCEALQSAGHCAHAKADVARA